MHHPSKSINPEKSAAKLLFLAGSGGLAAMYFASLASPVQTVFLKLEYTCFRAWNHLLGHNATLDWTILLGASRFWVYLFCIVALAGSVVMGWRRRREDYGRLFAYIGFSMLVTLTVEELADRVSDEIRRDLPWDIGVFMQIRDAYDADFLRIAHKGGVIEENVTGWVCAVALLAWRLPLLAALLTGGVAVHVLAQLTIGAQWMMSEIISVFVGLALAGAARLTGDGILLRWERVATQQFVKYFRRHLRLTAVDESYRKKYENLRARLKLARWEHRARHERLWFRIVEDRIIPILRGDPHLCELSAQPPPEWRHQFRASPRVRFLRLQTGEFFVIRWMRRRGGLFFPSRKMRDFAESAKCNLYLERLGMPVPRMHWVQEDVGQTGIFSQFFSVEEFLRGRTLDPNSLEEKTRAIELLARLHSNTSSEYGKISEPAPGIPSDYILRYLRHEYLYRTKKAFHWLGIEYPFDQVDAAWKLFEDAAVEICDRRWPRFRLIHGDVTPRNFLWCADGSVRMIDFVTVRYDLAGWETIRSSVSLSRPILAHCPALWNRYFEKAGPERWADFLGEARLALARFALRELAHQRIGKRGQGAWQSHDHVLQWIERLFDQGDRVWGERPEKTDWRAIFDLMGWESV